MIKCEVFNRIRDCGSSTRRGLRHREILYKKDGRSNRQALGIGVVPAEYSPTPKLASVSFRDAQQQSIECRTSQPIEHETSLQSMVFQLAAHPPFPASDKGWGKELGQNNDPFYITKVHHYQFLVMWIHNIVKW
ncbi:hypothetical protein Prudu_009570 [Prunus dulcis]|uniref:Uncharacterized protein n=1 Tax=Prunus dulcis TaxID=3755 RepID=A0A4Y1R6L7_PRUDU|nr:hypothetical protein Prudu_009570 [Prunus dulcis]